MGNNVTCRCWVARTNIALTETMRETDSPDSMELDDEESAVLALIRAKMRLNALEPLTVQDEDLAAYVLGTATPAQSKSVMAALASSPELSSLTLEIMRSTHTASDAERRAFDEANVPHLERFPDLLACVPSETPRTGWGPTHHRRSWVEWALGGWAVTATATACALLLVRAQPGAESRKAVSPPSPGLPLAPEEVPAFGLEGIANIALADPTRSGTPTPTSYRIAASARMIRISVNPPEGDADSAILISVAGPDGARLLDTSLQPQAPFDNLILTSRKGFKSGTYTLVLEAQLDSHREQVTHRFTLDVSSP